MIMGRDIGSEIKIHEGLKIPQTDLFFHRMVKDSRLCRRRLWDEIGPAYISNSEAKVFYFHSLG